MVPPTHRRGACPSQRRLRESVVRHVGTDLHALGRTLLQPRFYGLFSSRTHRSAHPLVCHTKGRRTGSGYGEECRSPRLRLRPPTLPCRTADSRRRTLLRRSRRHAARFPREPCGRRPRFSRHDTLAPSRHGAPPQPGLCARQSTRQAYGPTHARCRLHIARSERRIRTDYGRRNGSARHAAFRLHPRRSTLAPTGCHRTPTRQTRRHPVPSTFRSHRD